jgi:hypothetical protein
LFAALYGDPHDQKQNRDLADEKARAYAERTNERGSTDARGDG